MCVCVTLFLQHAVGFLDLGFFFAPQGPAVEDLRDSVFDLRRRPGPAVLLREDPTRSTVTLHHHHHGSVSSDARSVRLFYFFYFWSLVWPYLWRQQLDELVEEAELGGLAVEPFPAVVHAGLESLEGSEGEKINRKCS